MTRFETFRDSLEGGRFVVIGDGESFHDLGDKDRCLPLVHSIGVNRTFRGWISDFGVCMEGAADPTWDLLRACPPRHAVVFSLFPVSPMCVPIPDRVPARWPGWTADFGACSFRMSPLWAAVLAGYMGASKVGLIGVDLETHKQFGKPAEIKVQNRSFSQLAQGLERLDCRLTNLSPRGALDSLPREDFEEFCRCR